MTLMNTEDKVDFFRYSVFIGILSSGVAVVLPESLQANALAVGIGMVSLGILGWGLIEDPQPVPLLWWLLGWRTDSVQELSDFKISIYYSWLQFKNSERLVFFRKYTSMEIADAMKECKQEVETRDTLHMSD